MRLRSATLLTFFTIAGSACSSQLSRNEAAELIKADFSFRGGLTWMFHVGTFCGSGPNGIGMTAKDFLYDHLYAKSAFGAGSNNFKISDPEDVSEKVRFGPMPRAASPHYSDARRQAHPLKWVRATAVAFLCGGRLLLKSNA
jgi:hypothetical protein